jgi:uncharacterized membrane protein
MVMTDIDEETQARLEVGRGLTRELGRSRARELFGDRRAGHFRYELTAQRSLSRLGFKAVMGLVIAVNVVVGGIFLALGAWPVAAFCGLDVLLIYWAVRANYRDGRAFEAIEVTPEMLSLTRGSANGARETFEFNPYWLRVRLDERPDGRNTLALIAHGQAFPLARLLSDDERREFAQSLTDALMAARSARPAMGGEDQPPEK